MSDLENKILKIIEKEKKQLDKIVDESNYALIDVLMILQQLEKDGLVQRSPGGYWKLQGG